MMEILKSKTMIGFVIILFSLTILSTNINENKENIEINSNLEVAMTN